jgi:hypothetical protein
MSFVVLPSAPPDASSGSSLVAGRTIAERDHRMMPQNLSSSVLLSLLRLLKALVETG